MAVTIRNATALEREECARQWVASFEPGSVPVTVGSVRRSLEPRLWRLAHRMLVASLLAECVTFVVVLDEVPHEPLAWICFRDSKVHYVYTVDKARHKGLASMLLRHVAKLCDVVPLSFSHMTAGGSALIRSDSQEKVA